MRTIPTYRSEPLTPEELRAIVKIHLPAWLKACASDSDAIVIHEAAFDTSGPELFLFACALKYAAQTGKMVHVACGDQLDAIPPKGTKRVPSLGKVFREKKRSHGSTSGR